MGTWTETREHAALDHLGTVRIWTDATGSQLPGFIYYPFGKQLTSYQDDEQIKFTGHERDLWNTSSTADDLDYLHARHYNPQIARFLQIDPLAGSVRAPQTLNRYSYVAGNPLGYIDPTGRNLQHTPASLCTWDGETLTCPGFQVPTEAGGTATPYLPGTYTGPGENQGGAGGGWSGGGGGTSGGSPGPGGGGNPPGPTPPAEEPPDDDDEEECAPWQKALFDNVAELTRTFTATMPAGSLSGTTPGALTGIHGSFSKGPDGSVSAWIGWGGTFSTGQMNWKGWSVDTADQSGGVPVGSGLTYKSTFSVAMVVGGSFSAIAEGIGELGSWTYGLTVGWGASLFGGIGFNVNLAPPSGQEFCE